jgi:phosphoribosyl-ATP pyrophosphohydrolase/phosphoribosyl-AMP cyclohydrolase
MTPGELRYDEYGVVPAVIQDAETGAVLMVGYMSRESLEKTLEKGETVFWSRSRRVLWPKGATSGNTQRVREIRYDCDADALLVRVEQKGVACHTGEYSCFHSTLPDVHGTPDPERASFGETLGILARRIHQRNLDRPEGSYTAKLLKGGIDRILKKIGEESGEVIIAAKNHVPAEITWEVADLMYHLLVMMEHEGIRLGDVGAVLQDRGQDDHGDTGRNAF